jgi:hypothetical protein
MTAPLLRTGTRVLHGLVERHIESLFVLDERRRPRAVNDCEGGPPPRLVIVRSAAGTRCLPSGSLPEELCRELGAAAAREPVGAEVAPWPVHRELYRSLLESHTPVSAERAGPAFVLPQREPPSKGRARLLEDDDRPLLVPHFPWLVDEFDEVRPIAGVVEDGAVVSVCRCARRRTAAVEAGIETARGDRGRGFGREAAARWAAAMYAEGRLPLYSTTWDNAASRRIAAALGGRQYAVDFSLE